MLCDEICATKPNTGSIVSGAPWKAMPRYFFNVTTHDLSPDSEGLTLSDVQSAGEQAVRASGEMLRELTFGPPEEWRMEVSGDDGRLIASVTVRIERYD
ncbi:DUF6894 family protein [Mesorhizobium captivum]|uniref:DUF6894 family protein n=1 Tax=Mesorhizobium captivum TaxID=3072319 RepID=UPI003D6C1D4C